MSNPMQAQIAQMFLSLLLMVGLIVVLAYIYRRFGLGIANRNNDLKILSTLALGTKEKLLLIQVGDQQLLVGATSTQITKLHELKTPIAIDHEQSTTNRNFKKILEGLKK